MEKLKEEGNVAFGKNDFSNAIKLYQEAIEKGMIEKKDEEGNNHQSKAVFIACCSNLALCDMKILDFHGSLAACDVAVKKYGDDCNVKICYRKAYSLVALSLGKKENGDDLQMLEEAQKFCEIAIKNADAGTLADIQALQLVILARINSRNMSFLSSSNSLDDDICVKATILDKIPRVRQSLRFGSDPDYYPIGHDIFYSAFLKPTCDTYQELEEDTSVLNDQSQNPINVFLGGVGDLRHAFATIAFIGRRMEKINNNNNNNNNNNRALHLFLNDISPQIIVRNLLMIKCLLRIAKDPSLPSMKTGTLRDFCKINGVPENMSHGNEEDIEKVLKDLAKKSKEKKGTETKTKTEDEDLCYNIMSASDIDDLNEGIKSQLKYLMALFFYGRLNSKMFQVFKKDLNELRVDLFERTLNKSNSNNSSNSNNNNNEDEKNTDFFRFPFTFGNDEQRVAACKTLIRVCDDWEKINDDVAKRTELIEIIRAERKDSLFFGADGQIVSSQEDMMNSFAGVNMANYNQALATERNYIMQLVNKLPEEQVKMASICWFGKSLKPKQIATALSKIKSVPDIRFLGMNLYQTYWKRDLFAPFDTPEILAIHKLTNLANSTASSSSSNEAVNAVKIEEAKKLLERNDEDWEFINPTLFNNLYLSESYKVDDAITTIQTIAQMNELGQTIGINAFSTPFQIFCRFILGVVNGIKKLGDSSLLFNFSFCDMCNISEVYAQKNIRMDAMMCSNVGDYVGMLNIFTCGLSLLKTNQPYSMLESSVMIGLSLVGGIDHYIYQHLRLPNTVLLAKLLGFSIGEVNAENIGVNLVNGTPRYRRKLVNYGNKNNEKLKEWLIELYLSIIQPVALVGRVMITEDRIYQPQTTAAFVLFLCELMKNGCSSVVICEVLKLLLKGNVSTRARYRTVFPEPITTFEQLMQRSIQTVRTQPYVLELHSIIALLALASNRFPRELAVPLLLSTSVDNSYDDLTIDNCFSPVTMTFTFKLQKGVTDSELRLLARYLDSDMDLFITFVSFSVTGEQVEDMLSQNYKELMENKPFKACNTYRFSSFRWDDGKYQVKLLLSRYCYLKLKNEEIRNGCTGWVFIGRPAVAALPHGNVHDLLSVCPFADGVVENQF